MTKGTENFLKLLLEVPATGMHILHDKVALFK